MSRSRPIFAGLGAQVARVGGRYIVSAKPFASGEWMHPWWVEAVYEASADGRREEWHAYVNPGFVNGRDAYIGMPSGWPDSDEVSAAAGEQMVALTDDPAPYLVLDNWRNPLRSTALIESEALGEGRLIFDRAEGYPEFFKTLNVRTASAGGATSDTPDMTPGTREIRAVDIQMRKPRTATGLDVQADTGIGTASVLLVNATYSEVAVNRTGGRARLDATQKFAPEADTTLDGGLQLAFEAGDPGEDRRLMSTVWLVSPPDMAATAEPDETWEPYVEYKVWWNRGWATKTVPPSRPSDPLTLHTGLAAGIGDFINDVLLSANNDANLQLTTYLNQANTRGIFWDL